MVLVNSIIKIENPFNKSSLSQNFAKCLLFYRKNQDNYVKICLIIWDIALKMPLMRNKSVIYK